MLLPTLPTVLTLIAARLPAAPVSHALSFGLNRLAWHELQGLDWQPLRGLVFALQVSDLDLRLGLRVTQHGFVAAPVALAAVTFTASAADFYRLAMRVEDPDTLFFSRRLRIEGHTDLGLRAKNTLDAIDVEAVLQRLPPVLRALLPRAATHTELIG